MGLHDKFYRAAKRLDVSSAWSHYCEARQAGRVDKHMTAELIKAATAGGRSKLVSKVWRGLRDGRGAHPLNAHLVSNLIGGFGTLGDLPSAAAVLAKARASALTNTQVYNAMLRAHSLAEADAKRRLEATDETLAQMSADGVPHDAFTLSIVLGTYSSAGRLERAQRLLAEAQAGGEGAVDAVACNSLLVGAARVGRADVALAVLESMEERGPAPNVRSYNAVLHALARQGDGRGGASGGSARDHTIDRVACAEGLRRRMEARGIVEDAATVSTLLSIYGEVKPPHPVLSHPIHPAVHPRRGETAARHYRWTPPVRARDAACATQQLRSYVPGR